MSDLVEKLRHLSPFKETQDIATEAAERIEALERERDELKADAKRFLYGEVSVGEKG